MDLIARLVLAGLLAAAAASKLASPASSRAALITFGVGPGPAQRLVWGSVIAAELGLAVAVAAGLSGAAYLAAGLMALFGLILVGALLQGRAGAPCACFGSRSKVGWAAVARNLLLAAAFAALPLLPSAELSADQWLGLGIGIALLACGGLAVTVFALAREVGMLRLQLGSQSALDVAGEGPALGTRVELIERFEPGPSAEIALAVFLSEGCHACHSLEPALDALDSEPMLTRRSFDEVRDAEAWRQLSVPGSPYAVALGRDGQVLAKGTVNNLAQVESVLATAERRLRDSAGEPVVG